MKTGSGLLWFCRAALVLGYVGLALWLLACPLLWILRDGLGPDSLETAGWAAVGKFAPVLGYGLFLAACVALLHLAEWLLRRQDNSEEEA